MSELIVYVDENGQPTGRTEEKLVAHHLNTELHLAFSCYIFNKNGEILVTQRALTKKVWPGVWTNSVCGHPGPGEKMITAIKRRAVYELGMSGLSEITVVLPRYRYKTPPFKGIIENEFCPVYTAKSSQQLKPRISEVENYTWMKWQDFLAKVTLDHNNTWSWWSKDQVRLLADQPLVKLYAKGKT